MTRWPARMHRSMAPVRMASRRGPDTNPHRQLRLRRRRWQRRLRAVRRPTAVTAMARVSGVARMKGVGHHRRLHHHVSCSRSLALFYLSSARHRGSLLAWRPPGRPQWPRTAEPACLPACFAVFRGSWRNARPWPPTLRPKSPPSSCSCSFVFLYTSTAQLLYDVQSDLR